ncbi:hypothetical protein RJV14_00770 [Buchnera aphidicola (Kurisakia onigurumii)]
MNENGKSVFLVSKIFNISLKNILIVHDDLDLKIGEIKFKYSMGSGGHNGLRSIITVFKQFYKKKNKNIFFNRLRIGIGRPDHVSQVCNFVLSKPNRKDFFLIKKKINDFFVFIN